MSPMAKTPTPVVPTAMAFLDRAPGGDFADIVRSRPACSWDGINGAFSGAHASSRS